MWTRNDNGSRISWESANRYCNELTLGGYKGWRLPTTEQLKGIYDPTNITGKYSLGGNNYWDIHTISSFHLSYPVVWSGKEKGSDSVGFFRFQDAEGFRVKGEGIKAMGAFPALCVRASGE
jgi:hypothetical protein